MAIGVKFGDYHSSNDLSLVLVKKVIEAPKVKEIRVSIPAGDGSIDLTESLTGAVAYEDRELAFTFVKIGGDFPTVFSDIQNKLHGKKMRITLDADPDYYYKGRVFVNAWSSNATTGEVEIRCTCEPFKYKTYPTEVDGTIGAGGSISLSCDNLRQRVIPTITVSGAVNVTFGSATYALTAGTHTITNIIYEEGDNVLTITGASGTTVLVEYQEGAI